MGAIMVAVVSTEGVIVLAYLISLPLVSAHYQLVIGILLAIALLFPVAFYHHSWSLWLGFDFIVESLPKYDPGKKHKELK